MGAANSKDETEAEAAVLRLLQEGGVGASASSLMLSLKLSSGLQDGTLWHVAARRSWLRVLRELAVQQPGDIDSTTRSLRTPLMVASQQGNVAVAELLLQLGANLSACDKRGESALHKAVAGRHCDVLRVLMQHGNSSGRGGASTRSSINRRSVLPVDIPDKSGFTPLHLAAALADEDCAQVLIQAGASLCAFSHKAGSRAPFKGVPARSTPLHVAAALGHFMVAKLMVKAYVDAPTDVRRPDPRILRDIEGHQPYMVAGNRGHWGTAQLLLIVSRDEVHSMWETYGLQLPSLQEDGSTAPLPSLAQLAHAVWLQHLQDQVSLLAGRRSLARDPPLPPAAGGRDGSATAAGRLTPRPSVDKPHGLDLSSHSSLALSPQNSLLEPQGSGACDGSAHRPPQPPPRASGTSVSGTAQAAHRHRPSFSSSAATGATCAVCFERQATLRMTSCTHCMCASCSTRVVLLEARKAQAPPTCPFCQRNITGFALASAGRASAHGSATSNQAPRALARQIVVT